MFILFKIKIFLFIFLIVFEKKSKGSIIMRIDVCNYEEEDHVYFYVNLHNLKQVSKDQW